MYCIKFTVGSASGMWCDPCIRGNTNPMTFHDKGNAEQEAETLNIQYNNEGYSFTVADYNA